MNPTHAKIDVAKVKIPKGRRPLRDKTVAALMASIGDCGLLQPIVVTADLRLIAGGHRLEACKRLGWQTIPAVVRDFEGTKAELAEIDENLIREDLAPLERAELTRRRKQIYEELHPDAEKRGGDRRSEGSKRSADRFDRAPSFVADTVSKTGTARRAVELDVQIAEKITDSAKAILAESEKPTAKRELLELARETPAAQASIAKTLASGEARTVKEAKGQIAPNAEQLVDDDGKPVPEEIAEAWRLATAKVDVTLRAVAAAQRAATEGAGALEAFARTSGFTALAGPLRGAVGISNHVNGGLIAEKLKSIAWALRRALPERVCPSCAGARACPGAKCLGRYNDYTAAQVGRPCPCGGAKKPCAACSALGFQTKEQRETAKRFSGAAA